MPTVELLPVNEIRISLSRRFLLKCYNKKRYLTREEVLVLRGKLRDIEKNIYALQHAQSIVEKTLLKDPATRSSAL
jgi:hypothetical protein